MSTFEEVRRLRQDIAELREELKAIRSWLTVQRTLNEDAQLVTVIWESTFNRIFSSRELVEYAQIAPTRELAQAMIRVLGRIDARKLGWWLKRMEAKDVCGMRIIRVGEDSTGVSWKVSEVITMSDSTAHFPME